MTFWLLILSEDQIATSGRTSLIKYDSYFFPCKGRHGILRYISYVCMYMYTPGRCIKFVEKIACRNGLLRFARRVKEVYLKVGH